MRSLCLFAVSLFLAVPPAVVSQEAPRVPQFDVVSIKPNNSGAGTIRIMFGADRCEMNNVTVAMIVQNAYGLRPSQVTGLPSWASSDHFDMQCKVVDADRELLKKLTPEQRRPMYQAILKERFGLQAHMETRNLPVYDLVVDKAGPKMQALAPQTDAEKEAEKKAFAASTAGKSGPQPFLGRGGMMNRRSPEGFELNATGVTMIALANMLSNSAGRNVVDKTGLTGEYTMQLHWSPEDAPRAEDAAVQAYPSIFTAVQEQLGLRLVAAKGDVEMLVVDHVERPSEN